MSCRSHKACTSQGSCPQSMSQLGTGYRGRLGSHPHQSLRAQVQQHGNPPQIMWECGLVFEENMHCTSLLGLFVEYALVS